MNATGKTISILLYVAALLTTRFAAPGAVAAVAIAGIAVFFALHFALRARTSRPSDSPDRR